MLAYPPLSDAAPSLVLAWLHARGVSLVHSMNHACMPPPPLSDAASSLVLACLHARGVSLVQLIELSGMDKLIEINRN